jgi:hypothetical protein
MITVTFTADSLEEVKKQAARWRSGNKSMSIKKVHDPICVRRPAGRVASLDEGKIMSASITIVYEDPIGAS